jgi:hypothetical protein
MARFAAYSARTGGRTQSFHARFGLTRPEDHSNDAVTVDADLIREQAPKTYAIPDLRNVFEMTVAAKMVSAVVPFGDTSAGQPLAIINARWTWGMTTRLFTPLLSEGGSPCSPVSPITRSPRISNFGRILSRASTVRRCTNACATAVLTVPGFRLERGFEVGHVRGGTSSEPAELL